MTKETVWLDLKEAREQDVKDFIQKLKEELHCKKQDNLKDEFEESGKFANMSMDNVESIIDKLAGEELTKKGDEK